MMKGLRMNQRIKELSERLFNDGANLQALIRETLEVESTNMWPRDSALLQLAYAHHKQHDINRTAAIKEVLDAIRIAAFRVLIELENNLRDDGK